jgi:peptidoglycan/xylan/chitin deacetylase (PgdA/CDA1 family)
VLCITFDNFGLVAQLPTCPFPDIVPAEEWANYNQIGLTLGQPRLLNLLKQLRIPTTYFAEGFSAILHPTELKRWRDAGHEIALHAWKHEMWSNLPSKEREEELIALSVSSMKDVLGEGPQGFRPPGLKINSWSDEIFEKHGIRYVSQALEREPTYENKYGPLGITYTEQNSPILLSRLKVLNTPDTQIDATQLSPAFGGLVGTLDDDQAYELFHAQASAHERAKPEEPWVFIIHPFCSGNRAWAGCERFLRKLHAEFGSGVFKTARDAAFRTAG